MRISACAQLHAHDSSCSRDAARVKPGSPEWLLVNHTRRFFYPRSVSSAGERTELLRMLFSRDQDRYRAVAGNLLGHAAQCPASKARVSVAA